MTETMVETLEKENITVKRINRVFFHIMVFINFAIFYVVYQLLVPVKVLELKSLPIKLDKKIYVAGTSAQLSLEYCKYKDLPSLISISFQNHTIAPVLTSVRSLPVGCFEGKNAQNLSVRIPSDLAPNNYKMLIFFDYSVSNLRKEHYQFLTEEFEIVEEVK